MWFFIGVKEQSRFAKAKPMLFTNFHIVRKSLNHVSRQIDSFGRRNFLLLQIEPSHFTASLKEFHAKFAAISQKIDNRSVNVVNSLKNQVECFICRKFCKNRTLNGRQ